MRSESVQAATLPEQALSMLLKRIDEGVLCLDHRGIVVLCNPKAQLILDSPNENLLLKNFHDYYQDDFFGFSIKEHLKNQLNLKNHFARVPTKSGQEKELEVSTIPYSEGLLVLINDITDLQRLQAAAHRSNRLKELGGMAALLAHEIRNPLGGIKGFASLLKRDLHDRPDMQHMVDFIIQGTDNLNNLVTNVLNYAHPFHINYEVTDLIAQVNDLLLFVKADPLLAKNIHFNVKAGCKRIELPLDKQLFRSALLNLIVNSVQSMPDGLGSITISLKTEGDWAVIAIADTGCGMSQDNLRKIFTQFFTTKSDGNGFGLLEVHKVIQAHKGNIEVISNALPSDNHGTVFTLKLPLQKQ